jgi:two-component system sensor histidine kinase DegS
MLTNKQLAVAIQDAVELERSRIACDLHDGVAQQLALALLKLEYLQHLLDAESNHPALAELQKTASIIQGSLVELRHCITSSVPLQLTRYGLSAAMHNLLEEYRGEGLQIEYECDDPLDISISLEVCIYRFMQEALNNIRKHAHATQVMIRLHSSVEALEIMVKDNGCGLPEHLHTDNQGAGLQIMHARVQSLGGSWRIKSQPGLGTTLQVSFPRSHNLGC